MSSVPPSGSSSRYQIPGSRKSSPERRSTSALAEPSKTRNSSSEGTSSSDTDSSNDSFEEIGEPRSSTKKTKLVEKNPRLRSFPGFSLANSNTEESSDDGFVPLKKKKRRGVKPGPEDISRDGLSSNESSSDSDTSHALGLHSRKKQLPEEKKQWKLEKQRRAIESGANTGLLTQPKTPFFSRLPYFFYVQSNKRRDGAYEVLPATQSNYYNNADKTSKYGYETSMGLVDTLITIIKSRSTSSLSNQTPEKANKMITTILNNSVFSLPQVKANIIEILKETQWGTLGGAALSVGQSEGSGMATQRGLELGYENLVKMLSGNDSIAAKQMFQNIKTALIEPELMWFPADDPRRKFVTQLVAKGIATTKQISGAENRSRSDEDVWDQLREIYSRIFTGLYPQQTLLAPKPFTSNLKELNARKTFLVEEFKSNLLSKWSKNDIQNLINTYLSGSLPEQYFDLEPIPVRHGQNSDDVQDIDFKPLFREQVESKPDYEKILTEKLSSLNIPRIFKLKNDSRQEKINIKIENNCFKRVLHQLSQELGANRQVNQAERSLKKGLSGDIVFYNQEEDRPALKALIKLYVEGHPLSERNPYPQVSDNANSDQQKTGQGAFDKLVGFYHESKKFDFKGFPLFQELERQLGPLRQKALGYQEKVKQIDELVKSYPEEHRTTLKSAAISCLDGEPLRIALNGVSGTGKTHFIKKITEITGRPLVWVQLTQGKTGGTKADDLMKPVSKDSSPLNALDKRLHEIVGELAEKLLHAPKNAIVLFDEGFGALINDSQLLALGNTLLDTSHAEHETAIGIKLKLEEIGYALTGNVNLTKKLKGSNFYETPDKDVIKSVLGRIKPFFIQLNSLHQETIDAKIDKKFDDLLKQRKDRPYYREIGEECKNFYKTELKNAISNSDDAQSLGMRVATRPFVDVLLDHLQAHKKANPGAELSTEDIRKKMMGFITGPLLTVADNAFSSFADRWNDPFRKANSMLWQFINSELEKSKADRLDSAKGTLSQEKEVEKRTEVIEKIFDELYNPLMGTMQSMFMSGVKFTSREFLDSEDCKTIYTQLYDKLAPEVNRLDEEMSKHRPGSDAYIEFEVQKEKLYEEVQEMISVNGMKFVLSQAGSKPEDMLKDKTKDAKPSLLTAIDKIKGEIENFNDAEFAMSSEFKAVIADLIQSQSQADTLKENLGKLTSDSKEYASLLSQRQLLQEDFSNKLISAAHKFIKIPK